MLGFESAEELLALPSTSQLYVDPADRERVVAALQEDGMVRSAEYELRRRDGQIITVVENARVLRNADGAIIGYEGTLADISKRKAVEMQLSAEKEKAVVTLQSIGDAVLTADADGRVEYLNPVAEELTGWTTAEVQGRPVGEVFQIVNEATRQPLDSPILRCLREGRTVELDRAHAADQPQAAGDLDPGLGGADPRPRRHADRSRHGLPRREPGTAAAARADLPGHARPADRAHEPP